MKQLRAQVEGDMKTDIDCECKKCGHKWKSRTKSPLHCPNVKCQCFYWKDGIPRKSGRKLNSVTTFQRLIDKSGDCWVWKGSVNHANYGMYKFNGKFRLAHRLSYEIHIGSIPSGMLVCHKCDNPSCVNPDHLFLGTQKDNINDCVAKGRNAIGNKNWNTKLDEEKVLMIRGSDFSKLGSKAEMARSLGISQTALNYVLSGRNWAHV
jgi:hypothetical protein